MYLAERLHLNSTKELTKLVEDYPDHEFVIDFDEAKTIFKNVRKNNSHEEMLGQNLSSIIKKPKYGLLVEKLYPKAKQDEQLDISADSKEDTAEQI